MHKTVCVCVHVHCEKASRRKCTSADTNAHSNTRADTQRSAQLPERSTGAPATLNRLRLARRVRRTLVASTGGAAVCGAAAGGAAATGAPGTCIGPLHMSAMSGVQGEAGEHGNEAAAVDGDDMAARER